MSAAFPPLAAGVRVVSDPPPARVVLPRMDVAGFAGFAAPRDVAATPYHQPFAVESQEEFARAFTEVTLGRDAGGAPRQGRLGPVVRAFFRNGGRRAVVVPDPAPEAGDVPASRLFDPELAARPIWGLRTLVESRLDAGQPLPGLHALMPVEEVTMVAIPDASGPVVTAFAPLPDPAPPPDDRSPSQGFHACGALPETRIVSVARKGDPDGRPASVVLGWEPVGLDGVGYEVEARAGDRAGVVWRGRTTTATLYGDVSAERRFRVRAVGPSGAGPWSAAVGIGAAPTDMPRSDDGGPTAPYWSLVGAQRAVVRMCAARGDCLAVLALPPRLDAGQALEHLRALTAPPAPASSEPADVGAPPLDESERDAWSHTLAAHPWPVVSGLAEPGGGEVSPEGAVCGVLARVARTDGAWRSPAGHPLAEIVDLTVRTSPPAPPSPMGVQPPAADPADLEGVNLLRRAPGGVMLFADRTLARDDDLGPVGVRRLLHLLRRAALLNGVEWVFEPNGPRLARSIGRGFEELLGLMYDLGAFRGDSAGDAFRVRVANAPTDQDAGRIVVELRVAPARPLRFLTVRLALSGGSISLLEA